MKTVSYTHLDVYKRQVWTRAEKCYRSDAKEGKTLKNRSTGRQKQDGRIRYGQIRERWRQKNDSAEETERRAKSAGEDREKSEIGR